jgi:hypothetical protein
MERMELKDILNISGHPGLYKVISTSKNSFVVESLQMPKKRFVVSAASKVAALGDISIYTQENQQSLSKILYTMHIGLDKLPLPDVNNSKELTGYFAQILPDYDRDRVYVSDIKKIIKWYEILTEFTDLSVEPVEAEKSEEEDSTEA